MNIWFKMLYSYFTSQIQPIQQQELEFSGSSQIACEIRQLIGIAQDGELKPILINGPYGSGKKLIAQLIHQGTCRSTGIDHQLVYIPCFLSQNRWKQQLNSVLEGNCHSTLDLFLDGWPHLADDFQEKIASQIQQQSIRVIASQEFGSQVISSRLSQELLISPIQIQIPSLSDRKEDIPEIAENFLSRIAHPDFHFHPEIFPYLIQMPWIGNAAELRNAIESSYISALQSSSKTIRIHHFIKSKDSYLLDLFPKNLEQLSHSHYLSFLESAEREYLISALELCKGNASGLSRAINLSPASIFRKIKALNLRDLSKEKVNVACGS